MSRAVVQLHRVVRAVTDDAVRDAERAELLAMAADQLDRRRPVPCVGATDRTGWTSDDVDAQRLAAAMCAPCSVIAMCRAFGQHWPHESGVYGAVTDDERRPRRGRPRTTEREHE